MAYKRKVVLAKNQLGEWVFDNGKKLLFVGDDKEKIAEYIEQVLWPILAPVINAGRPASITVECEDIQ